MTTYRVETENEDGWTDWIDPEVGYKFCCCDCGLVHRLQLDIDTDGHPIFRVHRDNRATGQVRRWKRP